jgi:hypothetical protein
VCRCDSCCARTLTNEEAEAHLYLALHNHGGAALAAQSVSADAGRPQTAAAVRASLRELSAVPMQLMWAAEHCTAEHMRQKEYIASTFDLRQVRASCPASADSPIEKFGICAVISASAIQRLEAW